MPVPLNPFLDVTRAWLTECYGYLVNDSVPVLPALKTPTPSDIDLVATRPPGDEPPRRSFAELGPNLLVECKGWFDYSRTAFFKYLELNLVLLREHRSNFLPSTLPAPRRQPHLFFLRQEVYEKGQRLFGTGASFQRVIVGPYLLELTNSRTRSAAARLRRAMWSQMSVRSWSASRERTYGSLIAPCGGPRGACERSRAFRNASRLPRGRVGQRRLQSPCVTALGL